jgi:hypothetical protein
LEKWHQNAVDSLLQNKLHVQPSGGPMQANRFALGAVLMPSEDDPDRAEEPENVG